MSLLNRFLRRTSSTPSNAEPAPNDQPAQAAGTRAPRAESAPAADGERKRKRRRRRKRPADQAAPDAPSRNGAAPPAQRAERRGGGDRPRSQRADRREPRRGAGAERNGRGDSGRRRSGGKSGGRREPRGRAVSAKEMSATQKALLSGGYELPPISAVDDMTPGRAPLAFRELGISERMLAAIAALGLEQPTPIQAESIPLLLDGVDVVGQAQTGTGKTIAFGVPAVEACDPDMGEVQAIVLTPTRELAAQVGSVLDFLARAAGLEATVLMGGRRLDDDFANLERLPQIVVGTPGRIIDHLERRTLSLNYVRLAVLDEADRMLDIGFEPDMRRILRRCPDDRRTALFSATIPTAIKTLIWKYMREPEHVHIAPEAATAHGISQRYYEVADRDKIRAVEELLPELDGRTLVFCNMKVTVDRLVNRLQRHGLDVDAIHGDRDQRKRDRVMQRFRAGELQILVATDVAARGLDIPDVQHVINYDLPHSAEDYVHRVGRTGRAGKEGSAVSFAGEWDLDSLERIQELVGDELERAELALYAPAT